MTNDVLCPHDCKYLSPKEHEQYQGEPHRCLQYKTIVKHNEDHSRLRKCTQCLIDTLGVDIVRNAYIRMC